MTPFTDLGFDLDAALRRESLSIKDLEAVRSKLPVDIPKSITNKQLSLFLRACGGVEETIKTIIIYYEAKRNSPEHFSNRDPTLPVIQQCLQNQHYFFLPTTPSGHELVFHRLSNSTASNYMIDEAMKTFFMTIDLCLYERGPRPGIIFLFDMKHVGLSHLTRIKLGSIRKFFHYLQDALPAKLHSIHVFNTVYFFDTILAMIRPFMNAEILNMLHLHRSSMDLEKFYAEHIPKSCLPSDFGGDLASVEELHANYANNITILRDYVISEEEQCYGTAII